MPGSDLFLQTIDAVYAGSLDSACLPQALEATTDPEIRRVERTAAIELRSAGQCSAPHTRNIPPKSTTASRMTV
jgi:hypothetical protein